MPSGPRSPVPHVLFGAFVVVAFLAFVWPVYGMLANSVEPTILGLPFVFAWNVIWVLATFVALCLYHFAVGERD